MITRVKNELRDRIKAGESPRKVIENLKLRSLIDYKFEAIQQLLQWKLEGKYTYPGTNIDKGKWKD